MRLFVAFILVAQFAQRPTLSPAETLLEPLVLRAIDDAPSGRPAPEIIGTDSGAGEIWISCYAGTAAAVTGCPTSRMVAGKLRWLIEDKGMNPPARTIRFMALASQQEAVQVARGLKQARNARVAIHLGVDPASSALQLVRSPWSHASIADEVMEVFARRASGPTSAVVDVKAFRDVGQPLFETVGVPTVTVLGGNDANHVEQAAKAAAAAAYFLATIPNAGSEALLSHLTVGAHARLAEDGRRAVAQMGNQQRAGADVLIMFGQAIEREQRRMRSFERYMPEPVDPALRARITDMEKGITNVWTSMGITSSPYVPPAERIRGRGGEDRRVVTRLQSSATAEAVALQASQLAKLPNSGEIAYEILNFVDGRRSISDIRDAVMAEFGNVPLSAVVEYVDALAKSNHVTLR